MKRSDQLIVIGLVAYGCTACVVLGFIYITQLLAEVTREREALGNRVIELEARLPCAPTFELTCGIGEDGDRGLYVDGSEKRFRYAINGADLGVVNCYLSNGTEVLP